MQGAVRSVGYVALVGVPLLALMAFGVIPATVIGYGAVILTGLSSVVTVGMFSGQNALTQYHQGKHNQLYEAKLAKLEGRDHVIERDMDDGQHSPRVSTILQEGARSAGGSFTDAEQERSEQSPKTPTIH